MEQQVSEFQDARRLELAMEAAELDLWENDLVDGTITRPATRIYAELGYTPDEVSGLVEGLFSIVHPDDVAPFRHALAEHLAGRTARYQVDFRVRAKSGEWVWYANHGKIMDRDGPEPGRRFVGITFNVDAARRAEAQRATLSRAVKLLSSCGAALMRADSEQQLLESICALAVDVAGYAMAWVSFPDDSPEQHMVPVVVVGGGDLAKLDAILRERPGRQPRPSSGPRALREAAVP